MALKAMMKTDPDESDIGKVPYRIVHNKMFTTKDGKYESEIRLIKSND